MIDCFLRTENWVTSSMAGGKRKRADSSTPLLFTASSYRRGDRKPSYHLLSHYHVSFMMAPKRFLWPGGKMRQAEFRRLKLSHTRRCLIRRPASPINRAGRGRKEYAWKRFTLSSAIAAIGSPEQVIDEYLRRSETELEAQAQQRREQFRSENPELYERLVKVRQESEIPSL